MQLLLQLKISDCICFTGSTDTFGFQGQGSYSWTGDFAGKVWVGFFQQEVTGLTGGNSE